MKSVSFRLFLFSCVLSVVFFAILVAHNAYEHNEALTFLDMYDEISIGLVFLAISSFAGIMLAKTIASPLNRLTGKVDAISHGKFNVSFGASSIREINELSSALSRILTSLKLAVYKSGMSKEEIGLSEAVAAKKSAEFKLGEREQELGVILENIRDLVYRQDRFGKFTYISDAIKNIAGYSPNEWLKHYTKVMTDNPINKKVIKFTEAALKTGKVQAPYLVEVYHKNGSKVLMEVSETPIFADGKVSGIIGVARPVNRDVSQVAGTKQKARARK